MSGSRFTGRAKTAKSARPSRATACRGSPPVLQLKRHNKLGYRRPELNLQPCTDRRKGFLLACNDRSFRPDSEPAIPSGCTPRSATSRGERQFMGGHRQGHYL
jgi:hypothetical protein